AFVNTPWYGCYRAISSANDGLAAIARGVRLEQEARAKAFAKFVQGIAYGWLAAMFDKAFTVDETVNLEDVASGKVKLEFKPYREVWAFARQKLLEAAQLAEQNSFTIPNTWINGLELTNRDLAALCYAFLARYEAAVARSPQERAQVNWNQILQWISRAVTRDYFIQGDNQLWWAALPFYAPRERTARVDYKVIGPTDGSTGYLDWLSKPVEQRTEFILQPVDRRVGTALNARGGRIQFTLVGPSQWPAARGTYKMSRYIHSRYFYFLQNGGIGPMPFVTVREMRLLRAEGLLRLNQRLEEVVQIINETRVENGGLAPAALSDGVGTPADGNPHNIEHVRRGQVRDGSLWAKLKYEWRLENFVVTSGLAYFTRRGWGELVSGTPLHYPVPANELETLRLEVYTHGGNIGDVAPRVQANVPYEPDRMRGPISHQ
ncbi:MAG: RagB/SusD family nutrient uptake outer membrane protein, partial [Bacteroidota bacterium]|nr:RagB/SusD family nutrient uptake outer membrane protein [Bacteroidota bacterium]